MPRYDILPNIIWKVENHASINKKSNQIAFMDMNWKLKFVRCPGRSCDGHVKIFLRKLGATPNLPDSELYVHMSVVGEPGSYNFFQRTRITFDSKEWCIWSQKEDLLKSQIFNKHEADMVFLVSFLPTVKWANQAQDMTEAETVEIPPCLETLIMDFQHLFKSKEQSDVVLVCGGQEFLAHKAILSARSRMFSARFRNDMTQTQKDVVDVPNVEPSILKQFLHYLYAGEISDLTVDSARKLYAVANRYDVPALKTKCTFFLVDNFRTEGESQAAGVQGAMEENRLLKELFLSDEWEALSLEYPELSTEMCESLINQIF